MNVRRSSRFINSIARQAFNKNECKHIWGKVYPDKDEFGFDTKYERCVNCPTIHEVKSWKKPVSY
jgi:hypothetical protein